MMPPKCKEAFDFFVYELEAVAWTKLNNLTPRQISKLQVRCIQLSSLLAQAREEVETLKHGDAQ
jgi:hypothetical protein